MKRRNFLKGLLGLSVAMAVPVKIAAKPKTITRSNILIHESNCASVISMPKVTRVQASMNLWSRKLLNQMYENTYLTANPKINLSSTPEGSNEFYKMFADAQKTLDAADVPQTGRTLHYRGKVWKN